ncbi:hypothetical protein BO83DRAFT_388894 [Aspergillus eucalypticola CBS 122712]|uniref:Uncharacterized protein n=1 Tax=Aspergillus eucalypticola (strain CBS 122712 / IBT 29274) TaxID=1448314 RepID=A0A317VL03_ASPEC|nr:uncharacterized protein BO83DRAFT_388894 [Aspergillus eucalypticola CBS 122712]PWY73542.1 hypothetical protein BO83DRAFT_388894 [Aspergillus eucalypticola CBS 122712]
MTNLDPDSGSIADIPSDLRNFSLLTKAGVPMTSISKGSITLNFKIMSDKSNMYLNWLTSTTDLEVLIVYMYRLFGNPAMAPIIISGKFTPGPKAAIWTEIKHALKNSFRLIHYPVTILRMGRADDPCCHG